MARKGDATRDDGGIAKENRSIDVGGFPVELGTPCSKQYFKNLRQRVLTP